jgi:hypothetical protein
VLNPGSINLYVDGAFSPSAAAAYPPGYQVASGQTNYELFIGNSG